MAAVTLLLGRSPVLFGGEVEQPKFLLAWGKAGEGPGEFDSPIHIAINSQDEVYVADLNNARVQKFSTSGEYLSEFSLPLDAPPRISCIVGGLAVDAQGLLYVSFMNQHKIGVYRDDGQLVRQWGNRGAGDGEFDQPGAIVLRADGTLYVTDQCNHRVQKFHTDGTFLAQWGEHGTEPGQFGGLVPAGSRFAGPHFLAQDSRGRIYTTEASLGRVQQFTLEGQPLLAWGDKGDQPGGFGAYEFGSLESGFGPIGILVDQHDRVWVSSLNDRVQCFTPEGEFLFGIEGSGQEGGEFIHPHGMAVDSKGHLYVADAGRQRIQKFAIPVP